MPSNDDSWRYDEHLSPPELYRLKLDGEWGLWEFVGFGRQYVQSYALYHVLIAADRGDQYSWYRLEWFINSFPWRGGWSTVDFFDAMIRTVPREHLPRIRRIQYSSPGYVELTVGFLLAARSISKACEVYDRIQSSYAKTQKTIRENKLADLDIRKKELSVRERELSVRLLERQIDTMGIGEFSSPLKSKEINPLAAVKMLLSLSRRIKALSRLRKDDNIEL